MKQCKKSLSILGRSLFCSLLLAVLAVFLPGCNGDVFITKLTVSVQQAEVSAEHSVARIGVSGKNWIVKDINFYNSEEYINYGGVDENGRLRILTAFTDLSVRTGSDYVEVELVDYAGNGQGTLTFTVTDGYEYLPVEVGVLPTKTFGVKVEDVSYTLDSWSGYPDDDFTEKVFTYAYPEGVPEATVFEFPSPNSLPVKYFFEASPGSDRFAYRVLNSGRQVPIPSYTFHSSATHDFWAMAGDVASLSSVIARTSTNIVPPLPAPVELPTGTPLIVAMTCDYEAVALECHITALNETTGTREVIRGTLRMWVPVKFNVTVEKK